MILPAKLILTLFWPLSVALLTLHHGWANYDQTKTLDYTGLVEEIKYENPHGMLTLQHEDKTWTVVLAPPSRMSSRGLSKDMIQAGDSVRVVGYPHKEVKDEMRAERIYVGDKKIELR
jgi:membrane protein implicated in regulation of membrane protease activity